MSNGTLNISPDGDGGVLTVGALNLSRGALTVYSGGRLQLKGTLRQTGGTLTLEGGMISGGTIDSTAGTLAFTEFGGTMSGVTFDGPLNVAGAHAFVALAKGTTVVGSSGSGPGTINVTGAASLLYFDNTQTVSNVTINLDGPRAGSALLEYDTAGAGNQVLTLASSVTVDVVGNAQITDNGYSGDGIVNDGAIDVTGRGSFLEIYASSFTNKIYPMTFTNSGTIDVANGDGVLIGFNRPTTFTTTASSVISIGANSSLNIDPAGAWTNHGSITLASGASLYLGGSISAAGLGSFSNSGGTVYLEGTFNNSGHTLNGSSPLGPLVLDPGTISGGTVTSAGVAFTTASGGTLSGVTFDGPLNLTGYDWSVDLANGTTVIGSSGTGPGTINVTGEYDALTFDNRQTVSNVTINLGNNSGYDSLSEYDTGNFNHQVLTLASSVTVHVVGDADIYDSSYSAYEPGDGIVNDGAIDVTASTAELQINSTTFTNNGTIEVESGGEAIFQPAVTGTGTDTISGDSALEFKARVSSAKTLGDQDIDFTGGGGSLDLLAPTSFYSEFSDFGSGDTVELNGSWAFSAISHSHAGGVTTLTLASGSTTHAFEFVGDYTRSEFHVTPGTTTKIGYV
jgi:hypothetical protein